MSRLSLFFENHRKKEKPKLIIGFFGYWVVLTYLGVISAITGINFAFAGNIEAAIVCLMIAGFCDMFDGPVARLKKRNDKEKSFGIQIDSLADLIGFGALPVAIGYAMRGSSVSFVHTAAAALYVLAALTRLAYFNVVEIELNNRNEKRKYYEGMPVTLVALIIPVVYSFCAFFDIPFSAIYSQMLVLISIAFILKVKTPKLRSRQLIFFILIAIPIFTYLFWTIGNNI